MAELLSEFSVLKVMALGHDSSPAVDSIWGVSCFLPPRWNRLFGSAAGAGLSSPVGLARRQLRSAMAPETKAQI